MGNQESKIEKEIESKVEQGPKTEKTALEIVRELDSWYVRQSNAIWDLKKMTAEEVSDAIGDKIAQMSKEVGFRNPNPDNDDTEQDE